MNSSMFRHPLVLCGLLWCLLVATVLMTRPLLATIETRAMAVAWEMHASHNTLVPSLNFKPYAQKPPLLPWLINAGWTVFGVQRWIATVLIGLFSFGALVITYLFAKRFWPQDPLRVARQPWLTMGLVIVQIFGTLIFYDFVMTFFVVAAVYALWRAAERDRPVWWLIIGACLGLGGLTKGPAVVVHVLPLALLAPVWTPQPKNWARWYGQIILAVAGGCAIAYSWALQAAVAGGPDYASWILARQTTQRVVKAFSHKEAWWYYLALLPIFCMPWLFLPRFWQGLATLKTLVKSDAVTRFLLCWFVPVFVIFSAFSGKQLHYILPLFVPIVLLINRILPNDFRRQDVIFGVAPFLVLALAWIGIVSWDLALGKTSLPPIWQQSLMVFPWLSVIYGVCVLVLLGFALRFRQPLIAISMLMLATFLALHVAGKTGFARFSTEQVGTALTAYTDRPIGIVDMHYQGDVTYFARLTKPMTLLPPNQPETVTQFFADHPDGVVLNEVHNAAELGEYPIIYAQPTRSKRLYAIIEKAP